MYASILGVMPNSGATSWRVAEPFNDCNLDISISSDAYSHSYAKHKTITFLITMSDL